MADAEDLKSSGAKVPCGFESRPRHPRFWAKTDFRGNDSKSAGRTPPVNRLPAMHQAGVREISECRGDGAVGLLFPDCDSRRGSSRSRYLSWSSNTGRAGGYELHTADSNDRIPQAVAHAGHRGRVRSPKLSYWAAASLETIGLIGTPSPGSPAPPLTFFICLEVMVLPLFLPLVDLAILELLPRCGST